jgi:hypothetical protein
MPSSYSNFKQLLKAVAIRAPLPAPSTLAALPPVLQSNTDRWCDDQLKKHYED